MDDPLDLQSLDELEARAREVLPAMVFDYYAGGAGDEWTLAENRRAFDRWMLRHRVLVDVSRVELEAKVLGRSMPMPILIAPTAFQRMAHPEGELATARAAMSLGATMIVSTISTFSLEDIAATGVPRWFQLYVMKDRDLTADLVRRAHVSGYEAMVLTVDTPVLGRRIRDERNRFDLPPGIVMANLDGSGLPNATGSGLTSHILSRHDDSLTWDDLAWLRSLAPMPLVLKGVVTAEDTRLAVDAGVDALIVSNHGGRQLDGAVPTIEALPEVVDAAAGRLDVLVDGGVRRGADVVKALALGACAVCLGRPILWGLATGGEAGVRTALRFLRDDLTLAMALSGQPAVSSVDRSLVRSASGPPL